MRIFSTRALPLFAAFTVVSSIVLPTVASAQTASAAAKATTAANSDYRLAPDDIISVVVARHPEMSLDGITIPTSGRVTIPEIGEVFVAGKTLAQARVIVVKALSKVLRRPDASVILRQQRKWPIIVLGSSVGAPGNYQANPGWRVLDALAAAGGLKTGPELVDLTLVRANGTRLPLNMVEIQAGRAANPLLQAKDQLIFRSRTISVTITGQVTKPGTVELSPDGGLAELLAQSGGTLPSAALTQVVIKHADGSVLPVNLRAEPDANPKLQSGDLIVVPQINSHVTLSGAVAKPGIFNLEDGRTTRLADLLAQAGGPSAPLDTLRIELTRSVTTPSTTGVAGATDVSFVRTPITRDSVLQDGDIIEITPIAATRVTISGEVGAGGSFELRPNEGLPQLLARAGGPKDKAVLSSVVVQRGKGQNLQVDAYDAVKNGTPLDFPLQDGDYIVVPTNAAKIYVTGGVGKSDYVTVPERGTFTLGQALAAAGGTVQGAKVKEIGLLRNEGQQKQVINLNKTYNGLLAINLPLQRGDVVVVPESGPKKPSLLTQMLQVIPIAGLLFR